MLSKTTCPDTIGKSRLSARLVSDESERAAKVGFAGKTFITTISLFFVLFISTSAQVIRVPDDMGAIQDALNAASPGDTVIVSPGTYYENLVWPNTQGIYLMSEFGPDTTIIDGSDSASVIQITTGIDTTTKIIGFTIQNGFTSWLGAGIFIADSSSPVIANNIITQNTSDFGAAGILCYFMSSPIIRDNIITGNYANNAAAGIACYRTSSVIIRENIITENEADAAAGILLQYCSSIFITNNVITGNIATSESGGGISLLNCFEITIDSNTISNNTAPEGGGVWINESETTIANNIISNNTADSTDGGGIFCNNNSYVNITGNTITGNQANYSGGGIYCDDKSDLNITGNTITGNQANYSGGSLYAYNSNLQINNCTFTENLTNDNGGAIYFVADTMYFGDRFQVELKNSQFLNNTASNSGAGVSINNWYYDTLAINVDIDNCEFIENSADNYSGLNIYRSSFNVSNSIFKGNTAIQYAAGAGFSRSVGKIWNCLFASNVASTGGGGWNSGGVSVWSWSNVDFMNCTFADNSASYGAGLTVGRGSDVTTTNCIYWGNSDDQIALDTYNNVGATLTVNYCDVQGGEISINVIDSLSTLNWGMGNADEDPLFVNSGSGEYDLQDSSPCISAATDSIEISGIWYYCPVIDIEGIPRPSPGGTIPDMGAYESLIGFPVGIEDNLSIIPDVYSLAQNYPNPFNPTTTIRYQIPESSFVILKVYDVLGSEIITLVNEEKPVGSYEIDFNAIDLPSGVYFYRLQSNEFTKVKKMILLK